MLNAEVVKRVAVTPELIVVHIRPDAGVPDFKAGQYMALGLPGSAFRPGHFPAEPAEPAGDRLIKRSYSICSAPSEKRHLEFFIAIDPTGALTSRMFPLNEGDRLFCASKAVGTFVTEDVPADCNLILVGTGTGVAPYVSMLRQPAIWDGGRRITLVWGVRYSRDLAYNGEFLELQGSNTAFSYLPLVSRQDSDWQGLRGRVQRVFEDKLLCPDAVRDHIYLAGNPGMVDDLERLLGETGYSHHTRHHPGNLHLERYW